MKKFALIVAGGAGNRMKNTVPKQFLELSGRPVLMHSFYRFAEFDTEMEFVLVLPPSQMETWQELCVKYQFTIPHKLAAGGKTRFHSVKNGLELINGDGIVFIHDGVRPLVALQTILNCYGTALKKGNALPVVSVTESVRYTDGKGNKAVDRSRYKLVQTPQTFDARSIKEAYRKASSENFTDDATVLENDGHIIHLVEGNRENIKITYPEDLAVAETFLALQ